MIRRLISDGGNQPNVSNRFKERKWTGSLSSDIARTRLKKQVSRSRLSVIFLPTHSNQHNSELRSWAVRFYTVSGLDHQFWFLAKIHVSKDQNSILRALSHPKANLSDWISKVTQPKLPNTPKGHCQLFFSLQVPNHRIQVFQSTHASGERNCNQFCIWTSWFWGSSDLMRDRETFFFKLKKRQNFLKNSDFVNVWPNPINQFWSFFLCYWTR